MPSQPLAQLTLRIEPSVVDRWPTLREYIAHRVQVQPKTQKQIAADMDMSPSILSKKLNQPEGETYRFTCDNVEEYIAATGDLDSVLSYLATKHSPGGDAGREAALIAHGEAAIREFNAILSEFKASKARGK